MVDLTQTVIPKSDQLNADDLIAGPRTITITRVSASDTPEQPVSVYFEGDNGKPWKPCKSMRRVLIAAWGPDASTFAGRSVTIYNDPEVQFGGMKTGGIRISHMTNLDKELKLALTATKARRAIYTVKPLAIQKPVMIDTEAAQEKARRAAEKGTEEFRRWWNSEEGVECRGPAKAIIAELQKTAADADADWQAPLPDPFADGTGSTPEEKAAFEAAIAEARNA